MSSPLDLPEVRSLIAEYLTQSDHARCAQVCWDWYQTFHILVWDEIMLTDKNSWRFDTNTRPLDPKILVRHSTRVRKLVCNYFHLPKTNTNTHLDNNFYENAADKRHTDPAVRSYYYRKLQILKAESKVKVREAKLEQQQKLVQQQPMHFLNLKDFTYLGSTYKPEVARMISRHNLALQRIDIRLDSQPKTSTQLWGAVASCTRLTSLSVKNLRLCSVESWSGFRALWSLPTLRHLYLNQSVFLPAPENSRSGTVESFFKEKLGSSKIQKLELIQMGGDAICLDIQLLLLPWCPDLETFLWRFSFPRIRLVRNRTGLSLDNVLKESMMACPKLVHLDFDHQWEIGSGSSNAVPNLGDDPKYDAIDQIFEFLQAKSSAVEGTFSHPLRSLALAQSMFGTRQSWQMIKSHALWPTTLHTLDLKDAVRLPGAVVQDMLCTLKNLRIFAAAGIRDTDVLNDPRPWVCLGLVRLTLRIVVTAEDKQERIKHRKMFLGRIGTLTALRELVLLHPKEGVRTVNGRQLNEIVPNIRSATTTTTTGSRKEEKKKEHKPCLLEPLKTLCRLEKLEFRTHHPQKFSKHDVEWMVQHWPRLRVLSAILHSNSVICAELRKFLGDHQVTHYHIQPEEPVAYLY
ncbi:hypothetical protein BGZ83_010149 [Gryganskiella cystojenkinii]|nr:hypothetical protein BGZ83_010149 [Gryganskiella cystojenkinii]